MKILYIVGCYLLFRIFLFLKRIFSKEFKQELVITVGETGVGKTSLVVALAINFYKRMTKFVKKRLGGLYYTLNGVGYPNVKMPEHFNYSDIDFILDKKKDIRSFACDVSELGVPGGDRVIKKRFPFGAYFLLDEFTNKADSRNWQYFSDNMTALLTYHRKAYYNINFICQDIEDVDKRIRKRSHKIRQVLSMKNYYLPFTNKILLTVWDCVEYTGPSRIVDHQKGIVPLRAISFMKKLLGFYSPILRVKYYFFGDIFERYDSRTEIAYFLNNLDSFSEEVHQPFSYRREFVKYYSKKHPLEMPVDYFKKSIKEKKKELSNAKRKIDKN